MITKHPNTGGLVSVGTVTAQLMYEVNAPEYITPDVVAHFDTIELKQEGKDRVLVYQALSNEPHRQSYFSSDQGGKTGVMPKHNEDFSNAEQKEKNKFIGVSI